MVEEFNALRSKIKSAAKSYEQLLACEITLDRLYNAGIFSAAQFRVLDNMIFTRLLKLNEG